MGLQRREGTDRLNAAALRRARRQYRTVVISITHLLVGKQTVHLATALKLLYGDSEAGTIARDECRKGGCIDESVQDVQPGAIVLDVRLLCDSLWS